jgi:hypothetical protein
MRTNRRSNDGSFDEVEPLRRDWPRTKKKAEEEKEVEEELEMRRNV